MRAWLHWLVLRSVPQVYVWVWRRRRYFWLQVMTDPAADPTAMFDELHSRPGLIPVAGVTPIARAFFVGDHATVTEALHNPDLQSSSSRNQRLPRSVAWIEKTLRPKSWAMHPLAPPGINTMEGLDHQRLRKSVSGWFSARRIASFGIERRVKLLLDEMAEHPTVDLMAGFCRQLPAIMIGSVFGLSADDVADLDYWHCFDSALTSLDVNLSWSAYRQNSAALARLSDWIEEQVRSGPSDGLPQGLAADSSLTDRERIVTSALMLEAGFVTTVHLLANGIRLLLDHPDQLDILRQNPQRWPNAVEEMLRMEAPLRFNARIAVRDTTLAGQRIKKGKTVILTMAAANHDPDVFPDPHTFDVTRENAREHLSFSTGRHYCLGTALARAEALIALPMFFAQFPDARLTTRPVRHPSQVMCAWSKLEVTVKDRVRT